MSISVDQWPEGRCSGARRFLWGGESDWQCFEERNGDGDLVARYTYSPGYIDDVAVQERDLNDNQDFADAGEVVYYHQNTLFSVYALTDASESVLERYRYDAYGGCTVLDADGSVDADGVSDVGNPYAFTGRRLDLESVLMQYRFRYYAGVLGRFLSRDRQEYAAGPNQYEAFKVCPTRFTDPLGLLPWDEIRKCNRQWHACRGDHANTYRGCKLLVWTDEIGPIIICHVAAHAGGAICMPFFGPVPALQFITICILYHAHGITHGLNLCEEQYEANLKNCDVAREICVERAKRLAPR